MGSSQNMVSPIPMNYSHYPYKNSHSDVPSFLSCKLHQIAILEPFYWGINPYQSPIRIPWRRGGRRLKPGQWWSIAGCGSAPSRGLTFGRLFPHNRRKFRSQTSNNMDRWKAEMGRVREEKKKDQKEKVSEERRSRSVYIHFYEFQSQSA